MSQILLSSSYRDRVMWKNPSEFEAIPQQSNCFVSKSTALIVFQCNTLDVQQPGTSPTVSVTVTLPPESTSIRVVGNLVILSPVTNYYAGCSIILPNGSKAIIEEYTYTNNNSGIITTSTSFGLTIAVGDTITISDPSSITLFNFFAFVPGGSSARSAYSTFVLCNETKSGCVPIDNYLHNQRCIQTRALANWTLQDVYCIREQPVPLTPLLSSFYTENEVTTSYQGVISTNDYLEVIQSQPLLGTFVAGSTTNVVICAFNNPVKSVFGIAGSTIITLTSSSKILSYNGITQTCTIDPPLGVLPAPLTPFVIVIKNNSVTARVTKVTNGVGSGNRLLTLNPPFLPLSILDTMLPLETLSFNLLQKSYDSSPGYNTLVNTVVTRSPKVCTTIRLNTIIIPNKVLETQTGGRLTDYPYLYLELKNVTSALRHGPNSLTSNNPNHVKALFRVNVYNISVPYSQLFVKYDAAGNAPTIPFALGDSLYVALRLSDGKLFKTIDVDTQPPLPSNPFLQINYLFSTN